MAQKSASNVILVERIQQSIYLIRGEKVMLDKDSAVLYGVETRVLNQSVRRNVDRFPDDFMFQLTDEEAERLRSQIVISNEGRGGRRYPPSAFTEQGIAMLSTVLRSKRAIQVNIAIMRTFIQLRRILADNKLVRDKIKGLENKYDEQFQQVFAILKQLMKDEDKPTRQIGFLSESEDKKADRRSRRKGRSSR